MKKNSKANKDNKEFIVNTPLGKSFRVVDSKGKPVRLHWGLISIGKLPALPGARS